EVLRLIANYIGGDPQVAETARLMRLPGSHNTRKAGENLPVTLQDVDLNRRYDLTELTDFLLEAHPIMPAPTISKAEEDSGDGSESGMSVEPHWRRCALRASLASITPNCARPRSSYPTARPSRRSPIRFWRRRGRL